MRRESFIYRFRFDLGILLVLLLFGVGYWLNTSPITFDTDEEEMAGITPPSLGESDVLLLLPEPDPEAAPESFSGVDFSLAWYNTLAQEVGPFQSGPISELDQNALLGVHLVVVTASAASDMPVEGIDLLTGFVKGGGSVIIELPGPRWAPLTGIRNAVSLGRWGKHITAADASSLAGDFNAQLLDTPLQTRLLRLDASDFDADIPIDVLLEIDGAPAHVHRRVGEGHVYVVAFDYGMALTALQQGLPESDLTIPAMLEDEAVAEEGEEQDIETTLPSQLVASPKLRSTPVPYADLLERHMMYAPLEHYPSARLWLFPETQLGAFAVTHEESSLGDLALYLAKYEHELGVTSTYFVSPDTITNDGLDRLRALGVNVGLALHRGPDDALYETSGVGRLQPVQTRLSMQEQRDRLEGWAGRRIQTARVRGQVWDRLYTSTFRKLAAAGVLVDASYGPTRDPEFGYLFGTGLPFHPLDTNGLALPLYEIPFLLSDRAVLASEKEDHITRLIQGSRSGFHQLITLDVDAASMRDRPRADILETWLRSYGLARKEHHWITNLEEYMRFFQGRRQSIIRSNFSRSARALTVEVELPALVDRTGAVTLPAPAVAVPLRYNGSTISAVTLNGKTVEQNTLGRTGDGILALIPVLPGVHNIVVSYEGSGTR